jgi:hypothetical protein
MTLTRGGILLALSCCFALSCDPEDACDPGYYADHGYCYLSDSGAGAVLDGGDESDGGEIQQNPNATFGMPCVLQSECGGVAPVCGGMMLPYCTNINCLSTGKDLCPTDWLCVDVSKYEATAPGIMSVCIQF